MVCLLIVMPHGIATSAVLRMQEIAACSQHHTEVALVSDWSPNLSFWSQMTPVATLHQPPVLPLPPYSPNCTYVAIIASDGDSLQVRCMVHRVYDKSVQGACWDSVTSCTLSSWSVLWDARDSSMQQKQQTCTWSRVYGKYMVLLREYKLLADELQ